MIFEELPLLCPERFHSVLLGIQTSYHILRPLGAQVSLSKIEQLCVNSYSEVLCVLLPITLLCVKAGVASALRAFHLSPDKLKGFLPNRGSDFSSTISEKLFAEK